MERKYGILSNYEPTYLDKMRWWMQDALTPYMGGDAKRAGAFVQDKVMPTAEFLPGVGDAMGIAEAADEFNQGNYGTAAMLGSLAAIGAVPAVGDVVQKSVKKGIRAYHGSPHNFEPSMRLLDKETGATFVSPQKELGFDVFESLNKKYPGRYEILEKNDLGMFSLNKIGTGEGGQAYGHGLYFAEAEPVAKEYRDRLGKSDPFNIKDPKMYEVNINADPNDFLDWDKPLSEQPWFDARSADEIVAQVKAEGREPTAIEKLNVLAKTSDWGNKGSATGQNMLSAMGEERLKKAGIPGIKYLDAGSRSAGDGSRNYVVFDDALIEILRKYGLAGLGIGAGASGFGSLAPQDENYQPPVL